MPFLTYLDPASVDPADLVNRDAIVSWLRASLDSFLRAPDKSRGRAVALLGDRGIGKSIVMREVVDALREAHAATTLVAIVDCRGVGDQRRLYHEIAGQLVDQLGHRDKALLDTARLLETVASFDSVERRVLEEHITHYKGALKLGGKRNLLRVLGVSYDVALGRSKQIRETLEGTVSFNASRLREAVVALFADLRAHELDVIVVLDNLDELRHEALVDEQLRTWLHAEIDGLLSLARAPIGLVVTARTYFAGSLSRQIDGTKVIGRLAAEDHEAIIRRRLEHEADDIRAAFTGEDSERCITALAELAHTPLALLSWFRYLAENELHCSDAPARALEGLLGDRFANINAKIIEEVVAAYEDPYAPLSAAELQQLCGDNPAIFKQLLRSQIVLPVDFWDPHEFVLAPELQFMCSTS